MPTTTAVSRRHFLSRSAVAAASLTSTFPSLPPALLHGADVQAEKPSAESQPPPVTRILAEWVVGSRPEDIPQPVRKEATRSVLNWIGVAVGGSAESAPQRALDAISPYAGTPKANLFGRMEKTDPLNAALINGISSHVLDFDDTHLRTIIHPAGPVASALFALSQDRVISGAAFLHAFVLGTEVECRLGNAIYPSHYEMGWHITGTCGVFGAAAACGKILDLNTQQMIWALGIASTQAAGLKIMFGSMCKSFHIGRAAENGLLAALLAQKNFTSAEDSIEGKEGYVFAASRQHDYNQITQDLGKHYKISQNTYKPFACGIVIHPAIDATLQLRSEHHLRPAEIKTIVVRANPLVLELTGKKAPATGLEGKFSVYHSVAVALVRGYAGPREYTDAAVMDSQIVAVRDRVSVITDPAIHPDEAFVSITTNDGRTFDKHVVHVTGSAENPMTDRDLENKARHLAEGKLPESQTDRLISLAWKIETLPDAGMIPREAAAVRS